MSNISPYLKYLPGIYHGADTYSGEQNDKKRLDINRFLTIFEELLSKRQDNTLAAPLGIEELLTLPTSENGDSEETVDFIQEYLNPYKTPPEFLNWLASWMALPLEKREEWNRVTELGAGEDPYVEVLDTSDTGKQRPPYIDDPQIGDPSDNKIKTANRELIDKIMHLYEIRGTKQGIEEYLNTYAGVEAEIVEAGDPLTVGASSAGENTVIEDMPDHYFLVNVTFTEYEKTVAIDEKIHRIRQILDREKPAHTVYKLNVEIPTIQIAVHSTIGVDTLLGDKQ